MADSSQYLRITLEGAEYVLPSEASISIEQRDMLTSALPDKHELGDVSHVAAWYVARSERWPAFHLGSDLKPSKTGRWQRAVFLEAGPGAHPIGLAADEVQLMPRGEMRIESFHPLGPAPTSAGPVFDGAWMRGDGLIMVLNPAALVAYLKRIWQRA